MAWTYKREEREGFEPIPEGIYRVRIASADKAISKNGRDMLTLQFDVSGYNQILYHYITFMDDKPEMTNRMLTQFFDAFPQIEEGDFNMAHWIGKVGACKVKHEEYNGNQSAKVHYFIHANKQKDLEPWKEPPRNGGTSKPLPPADGDGFMKLEDLPDIPF